MGTRNYMAFGEPKGLIPKDDMGGDFRNKRRPIQKVLEAHGIGRSKDLESLTADEIDEIRREVDFFEQNPQITPEQIELYYREGAEVRNSLADLIGEKGRDALKEIGGGLSKKRVQ